jgi:hypothetical protein
MDKASAFRDNAHAVIIGINQYEDKSIPDLNFARADAEAICNVNEVSLEISNMNHGLFTHYLIEGLQGKGDKDRDGLVTIDELYEYVYDNVSRHARKFGGSMRPVRKGSVTGKIYLTRYESGQLKKKTVEDLELGKKILFKLFQEGQLPPADFNQAITILQKDESSLSNHEHKIRGFLAHLIHGDFSTATYLEAIAFLKDAPATVEKQKISQPEPIGKDPKTHTSRLEKAHRETVDRAPTLETKQPADEPSAGQEGPAADIEGQAPTTSFRNKPAVLTKQQQKQMVVENGFYDRYRNPHSQGFANKFERTKTGTVIVDHASGLMWQQSGSPESLQHEHVHTYINQLNNENFAGFNDWRLPTMEEAMSLMERKQKHSGIYIDTLFDAKQAGIWTVDTDKAARVWVAYFSNGNCGHYQFGSQNYVRAVRSMSFT